MKIFVKLIVLVILLSSFLFLSPAVSAEKLKDSESASHSDRASLYDKVDTYTYPGFSIIQFNLAVLSHYS